MTTNKTLACFEGIICELKYSIAYQTWKNTKINSTYMLLKPECTQKHRIIQKIYLSSCHLLISKPVQVQLNQKFGDWGLVISRFFKTPSWNPMCNQDWERLIYSSHLFIQKKKSQKVKRLVQSSMMDNFKGISN